jgi:hypothetical protein
MTEGPRLTAENEGTHAQTYNAIPSWWPAQRGAQRGRRQSHAAGKRDLRAQPDRTDAEEGAVPDRTAGVEFTTGDEPGVKLAKGHAK